MDKVLSFHQGRLPLLISMPHAGLKLSPAVRDGLVEQARSLPVGVRQAYSAAV